jgi:protein TonB
MFAESMIEISWAQRTQRSWTALASFALQVLFIGVLLIIPLWKTVGLPEGRVLQPPIVLGPPPAPIQHLVRDHLPQPNRSNLADNILIEPPSIPTHVAVINETAAPPQVSFRDGMGVIGGVGEGSKDGILGAIDRFIGHAEPRHTSSSVPPKPTFRPSNLLQGSLIRRVEPVYPPLARTARIQGSVVLAAVISKQGTIQHLQVLSGHPMLVNAALEAVSQWRYRPYVLNGEVIEVETQITVNFKLN